MLTRKATSKLPEDYVILSNMVPSLLKLFLQKDTLYFLMNLRIMNIEANRQ